MPSTAFSIGRIPVISSALAVGSCLVYLLGNPARSYSRWCVAVLVLQAIVGSTGFRFQLSADLHGPSRNLFSNVISGAPPFAPLLLPNLAILGFLGLAVYNQQTQKAS